jgi:hypothetical protein
MRFPLNPSGREGTGFGSTYLNPRPISSPSCILIRVTHSLCNQTATQPSIEGLLQCYRRNLLKYPSASSNSNFLHFV